MCVSQFRDYCKASSFKRVEQINKNDKINTERGSFYNNGWVTFYVTNQKQIRELAKNGNIYAQNELKKR